MSLWMRYLVNPRLARLELKPCGTPMTRKCHSERDVTLADGPSARNKALPDRALLQRPGVYSGLLCGSRGSTCRTVIAGAPSWRALGFLAFVAVFVAAALFTFVAVAGLYRLDCDIVDRLPIRGVVGRHLGLGCAKGKVGAGRREG